MSKQLHFKSLLLLAAMLFGVSSARAVEVTDVLTPEVTGVSANSYITFKDKTVTSNAVYAGQCGGANNSIQLRSDGNSSGVITTTSGGKIKSIAVEWHTNNNNARSLLVYGSNTPYSSAADLFNQTKQGTLIGSIAAFTTTALLITGDYKYIGIRSESGTIYLPKVSITWETSVTPMPTIVPSPTSLTGFTYLVNNGPSAAKSFTVSGVNLTDNISVSVGASSDFELALTENSVYSNSLTINQNNGTVDDTTVYVRMKTGLEVNAYTGTITITSAGAPESSISLSGSVTAPEAQIVTWDLSKDQTATASISEMTWTSGFASMVLDKGSSETNANYYYPGVNNYKSTRFYLNQILTITPAYGYAITGVVFEATTSMYASYLQGSTWTNAAATVSGTTVTVTSTDGSSAISATIGGVCCGFTSIKVYCEQVTTVRATITAAGYATYCSPYALDFSGASGLTAYTASLSGSEVRFTAVTDVPANTGVLLKGAAGTYDIPVIANSSSNVTSALVGVTEATEVQGAGIFVLMNGDSGIGFYKTTTTSFTVGAHTAYIPALEENQSNPSRNFIAIDGATAIKAIETAKQNGEIFNLAGQRVKSAQKGLYIIGGKKVIK